MEIGKVKSETSGDELRNYFFEQVRVPRGCLGYVVADHDTRLAAIVDPELEMVEPMIDLLFKHGLRPAYIIDTYTHADHVYGARDLKCKTIAKLVMHEEAPSGAIDIRVKDGDRLALADLSLKFLHTSGHAKDLVSILLPGRILTADALLIGSCGRTNLLNGHAVRQYHTLYYTYKSLPDELEVWPGRRLQGPQLFHLRGREAGQPEDALRLRGGVRQVLNL